METVRILLDRKLLEAADRAARRTKRNRSALISDALRDHLKKLELRVLEERDREGYKRKPQAVTKSRQWGAEAVWPPG